MEDMTVPFSRIGLQLTKLGDENFEMAGRIERWKELAERTLIMKAKMGLSDEILIGDGILRASGKIVGHTSSSVTFKYTDWKARFHDEGVDPFTVKRVRRGKGHVGSYAYQTKSGRTKWKDVKQDFIQETGGEFIHPGIPRRPLIQYDETDVENWSQIVLDWLMGGARESEMMNWGGT